MIIVIVIKIKKIAKILRIFLNLNIINKEIKILIIYKFSFKIRVIYKKKVKIRNIMILYNKRKVKSIKIEDHNQYMIIKSIKLTIL